jgi:hypothetical protein
MNRSHENRMADRLEARPMRIQPSWGRMVKPGLSKGPEPLPHRYTAATVREFPRRREIHVFDPTW